MTGHLPYEEQLHQHWNDLPLPDADMAWADMRRRLDEDDDKRPVPFWLRGCAGWLLLGLLATALLWWVIRPEKWFKSSQTNPKQDTIIIDNSDSNSVTKEIIPDSNQTEKNKIDSSQIQTIDRDSLNKISINKNGNDRDSNGVKFNPDQTIKSRFNSQVSSGAKTKKSKQTGKDKIDLQIKKEKQKNIQIDSSQYISKIKINNPDSSIQPKNTDPKPDTMKVVTKLNDKPDSIVVAKPDSSLTKVNNPTTNTENKKDSTRKKTNKWIFSTGIGLQQQLPVDGQTWVPYNSQSRTFSLADYIPSVYLRLERQKKWFVQTEFRYGAPQFVKPNLIKRDTVATPLFSQYKITNYVSLKKTYYHELPFTFNYYIIPNWSVGVGLQWNVFYKAIVRSENSYLNVFTLFDSLGTNTIARITRDSSGPFKKTYWQSAFQTQYQWKRFSFGARYSVGLQPYINFTITGEAPRQEKNSSLQLFIRYELWKRK